MFLIRELVLGLADNFGGLENNLQIMERTHARAHTHTSAQELKEPPHGGVTVDEVGVEGGRAASADKV